MVHEEEGGQTHSLRVRSMAQERALGPWSGGRGGSGPWTTPPAGGRTGAVACVAS